MNQPNISNGACNPSGGQPNISSGACDPTVSQPAINNGACNPTGAQPEISNGTCNPTVGQPNIESGECNPSGSQPAIVNYGCAIYRNTEQCYTAQCSAGSFGESETVCVEANTHFSTVSQADADAQALASAASQATANLYCISDWTAFGPTASWETIRTSNDGSKTILNNNTSGSCCSNNDNVYTSINTGFDWTDRGTNGDLASVTISGDGSRMYAMNRYGTIGAPTSTIIRRSTDNGATWLSTTILSKHFVDMCCSDDGMIIFLVGWQTTGGGRGDIYRSIDGGETFSLVHTSTLVADAHCCCMTGDGTVGYIKYSGGTILKTTNSGASWTTATTSASGTRGIACDSTGSIVFSSSAFGVNKSTDGASSFTLKLSVSNLQDLAMSDDGQSILAAVTSGFPRLSTDGGETWTQQITSGTWVTCAMSSNGTVKYVASNSSIYVKPV